MACGTHDVVWHVNNLISHISNFTCRRPGPGITFPSLQPRDAPARTNHWARGITRPMVKARWFRRGRERCRVRIISPRKAPRPHSADGEKGTGTISWTRGERQRQDNPRQGERHRRQTSVLLRSPEKRRQIWANHSNIPNTPTTSDPNALPARALHNQSHARRDIIASLCTEVSWHYSPPPFSTHLPPSPRLFSLLTSHFIP
jgi:hypothetical protein